MRSKIFYLPSVASICLLFACSFIIDPETGGGTESPNFIKGVVVNFEKNPVENAEVTIRSHQFTPNGIEIIEEKVATSDEKGEFIIGGFENSRFSIAATYGEESQLVGRFEAIGDTTVAPLIVLGPTVTIQGRILNGGGVFVSVLGGLINVFSDDSGVYTLANVPTGFYDLEFFDGERFYVLPIRIMPSTIAGDTVFIRDVELSELSLNNYSFFGSVDIETFAILPVEYEFGDEPLWYQNRDFSRVEYFYEDQQSGIMNELRFFSGSPFLIDDFNYERTRLLIDERRGGNIAMTEWFFFFNDTTVEGGRRSTFYPENVVDSSVLALVTEGAYDSQSFHVTKFLAGDSAIFAGFGVVFAEYQNLSALEGVSFYARGEGTMAFSFTTRLVLEGYPEGQNWGHFSNAFSLSEQWQRYDLHIEDFSPRYGSIQFEEGLQWEQAADAVSGFEFITIAGDGDTASIWLDEFYFIGLEL